MAVAKDQVFGLRRLAGRTVVYAATATALVVLYVACVILLDRAFATGDALASAIAAAAAALALGPVRRALDHGVNRVVFGDRADPAAALAKLGDQLAGALIPSEVLPRVTDTVAASLRLPYVAIELADSLGAFRPAAHTGKPVGELHTEPLRHQGRTIGRLTASARETDEPWDADDLAVLAGLAQQIGVAAYTVLLHEDLQRSRAAVMASREDERARLRRDLHDGLGPALAAIVLKAAIARKVAEGPPDGCFDPVQGAADRVSVTTILDDIAKEASSAIHEIRHLVEALRPPALEELGLVDALRARAEALSSSTDFRVDGHDVPKRLPAAVEVAAYRIALEAMTNTARHAGARRCVVRVRAGELLELEIRDDGAGIDADPVGGAADPVRHTEGTGLRSMAERAAEVGGTCTVASASSGGTVVRALLPLHGAPLPRTPHGTPDEG